MFKNTTFLEKIFFGYLIVFPFYMPLRAMIIDTPAWRDVPISLMFFTLILSVIVSGRIFRFNMLDLLVLVYLCYGIVGSIMSDMDRLEAVKVFRLYFYVCLLYFTARHIFSRDVNFHKLHLSFKLLAILLAADILIENILCNVLYLDKSILPWFRHGGLYMKDFAYMSSIQASDISFIRVPTITYHPHSSLLLLGALTLYLLPFLLHAGKEQTALMYDRYTLAKYKTGMLLMSILLLSIILGYVKIVIIMIAVVIILYRVFCLKEYLSLTKLAVMFTVLLTAVFTFFPGFSKRGLLFIYMVKDFFIHHGLNPLYFMLKENLTDLMIGPFYLPELMAAYLGEVRILQLIVQFGIVWLVIYLGINLVAFRYCLKGIRCGPEQNKLFFTGCTGFIIIYFGDMFHYANSVRIINMDVWLVLIAAISSTSAHMRKKDSIHGYNRSLAVRA